MNAIHDALSMFVLRARFVLFVLLFVVSGALLPRPVRSAPGPAHGDRGQATAEYALVLLGAAAVALLLVAWASNSGKVDDLLNGVIDKILDQV